MIMSWCQIPQDPFRGCVESMPQKVSAVLVALEGPAQYKAVGLNVMASGQCSDIDYFLTVSHVLSVVSLPRGSLISFNFLSRR